MELYKRKDGKSPFWFVDVVDDTGKRIRRSTKCVDKRAATARAMEILREGNSKEITLDAALRAYERKLKADGKTSHDLVRKISDKLVRRGTDKQTGLERWGSRFYLDGSRKVSTLTRGDIEQLRVARAGEGCTPSTIAGELRTLRSACRYAVECGYSGPKVTKWDVPKGREKLRYLSVEEVQRALHQLHPDTPFRTGRGDRVDVARGATREWRQDAHDLLLAYVATGGRATEVNALTISQVDLERKVVRIFGKGQKVREVPLVEEAVAMFQRRVETAKRLDTQYLFPGVGGKQRAGGSRAVRRALDAAGCNSPEMVKQFGAATIHSLRHTYASWLRQNGMDLDELQPLLGHESPAMTRRYAKVRPGVRDQKVREAFSRVRLDHDD